MTRSEGAIATIERDRASFFDDALPIDFIDGLTISKMTLHFLPLQLLWITLASVDAMSSHFPEHSDGVEVQVTLRLHVIKEFIRVF